MTAVERLSSIIAHHGKPSKSFYQSHVGFDFLAETWFVRDSQMVQSGHCAAFNDPHEVEVVFEGDT